MRERNVAAAERLAQRKGKMFDGDPIACGRTRHGAWRGEGQRLCRPTHLFGQSLGYRIWVGGDQHVDRRKALVIHAPAVVDVMIESRRDDEGIGFRRLQRAAEIDPVEAQNAIGVL